MLSPKLFWLAVPLVYEWVTDKQIDFVEKPRDLRYKVLWAVNRLEKCCINVPYLPFTIIAAVNHFLEVQDTHFYMLHDRWIKCLNVGGDFILK